ncbi:hypothetical protein ABIA39_008409 [Nocardia sp. GAS34]|uniref:histone deacetylase n=1 Tax=unclassified Nocardia TaxID=2637762 RepID=UPI003D238C5B
MSGAGAAPAVWYVAYGSNLLAGRLNYYVEGGRPAGAARTYPGFRDRTPPRDRRALMLPGTVYFAWESPVWGGAVAFYAERAVDDWPRGAAARGYLLSAGQFEDLLAQEMYRVPGVGTGVDLDRVVREGVVRLGEGRYETLRYVGDVDGFPAVTFTAPWDPATVEIRRPGPRYLGMLAAGLRESHGWSANRIHAYLAGLPGVRGFWGEMELRQLVLAAFS